MKHIFLILVFTLALVSCKNENDTVIEPTTELSGGKCYPSEINYANWKGSGMNVIEKFYYDNNDRMVKIETFFPGYSWKSSVKYDNSNKIQRILTHKLNDSTIVYYNNFKYDQFNELLERYDYSLERGIKASEFIATLGYNSNGQLARVDNNMVKGPMIGKTHYLITYINNVTKFEAFNSSGINTLSLIYEWDNFKGPFSETKYKGLIQGVINLRYDTDFEGDYNALELTHLDASGIKQNDGIAYSAIIDYNDNGYPTKKVRNRKNDQVETIFYTYNCK